MNGRDSLPAPFQTGLFIILAFACILLPLMPMQLEAEARALPDLLFAFVAAWILRRPNSAPMLLVAALFLLADFVLGRPVGIWALLCLLGSDFLRTQHINLRDQIFPFEFLSFSIVLAIAFVLQTLILGITLVPQPSFSKILEIYVLTLIFYPAIVLILHYVFRVRAPQPEERSKRLGRVS